MSWTHHGRSRRAWMSALVVGLVALVAAGCGGMSSGASSSGAGGAGLVREQQNAGLGKSVLVDRQGMTLYALSAETHGRFVCTTADLPGTSTPCMQIWRPLTVEPGQALGSGIGGLATVHRPGTSALQVTYRGMPLYTFAEDHSAGQASGNGLRDLGIWHAVTVGSSTTAPASTTGGGSYGGY